MRTSSIWRTAVLAAVIATAGCARGSDGGDTGAPAPGEESAAAAPDAPGVPVAPAGSAAAPEPAPSGRPSGTENTAGADTSGARWTVGIVDQQRRVSGVAVLEAVRAARNDGFDRVVFQFSGAELPSYHLEYVDRPVRQCGSGNPVEIAGDGWLAVRLEPAQAHDDQGRATVQERERRLDLPVLKELQATCDFEAQVEWVLGVASPNRYRVLELSGPARLVVDVRH